MDKLSGTECFVTKDGLEATQVPDGFMVYDEANEKVHYLNPTAAVVYTLCDGKKQVSEIQALLREAYELEDDVELDGFFHELQQAGLVCLAE